MKEIVIIGAGGHGKEVAWLAKRCGRLVKGFLDNTPEKQGTLISNLPVLGFLDTCQQYSDCEFIIAIGSPRARKKILETYFTNTGLFFATLIDPTAIVGDNINIQEGVMICAGSILTVDVQVGRHCIVNTNAVLSHGVTLGDFVTIAPNTSISGDVTIGNMVEIGANATVREKTCIADGAMVGMGAVVTKHVLDAQMMVGNPARLLRIIE